ncbi:prolyl oligopeptidase family serine peptidase [Pontibacter sp. G13]|uniref:carboxylesterase family protein n=1 Tax=Pontibacter sp. G13 TaxID=3074898 RepID=UPI00288A7079|nr:prolyl oligopeptidase family serine peptidase [Pontibacter sp. G13]WNJ20089.1 prolyl oligopeptidase family serine peptidase [Pontibacter sp. G13]
MLKKLFRWALILAGGMLAFGLVMIPFALNDLRYSRFLVYPPQQIDEEPIPMLLFLHGSGSRGKEVSQIGHEDLPFMRPDHEFPFLVVAPQCSPGKDWEERSLLKLIEQMEAEYPIDPDRIYVTGLSLGGYGTWHLALRYPDRFAAIMPICGGANRPVETFHKLDSLPMWVFHGTDDDIVGIWKSHYILDEIMPTNPNIRFTAYEGMGHNVWDTTYHNPEVWEWLLQQHR